MTKRKIKRLTPIMLAFLSLFPIILVAISSFGSNAIAEIDFGSYAEKFAISSELAETFTSTFTSIGIALDGEFAPMMAVVLANTVVIYLAYIFLCFILWLPKLSIYFMERIGKNE